MYCEFYQLTERPFNVTPDPKFLYLNARYREAIASLNYGITQRKGFITLIGEAGTGKTTLLNKLLEDLDAKTKSVFIFNTNVTFEEILEYIFTEFDLPVHNGKKLYMLQRLNAYLLEELRGGGNVALLIDEAQDLEFSVLEDLRLLSNLETAKEKILQIVLSGQPELGQKLSNPVLRQLRQRIGINCRLLPLSRDEITEYVQYRLQAAGCPDLKLFSREAEEQIYHFSRGIPRLVNVVCDNALVIGYALGKKRIGADVITEAAADLLSVQPQLDETQEQPIVVSIPAPPLTPQRRWRTRLNAMTLVLVAVVVGLLSVGRTMLHKSEEGQGPVFSGRPKLEVIRPGSQPEGTGVEVAVVEPGERSVTTGAGRDAPSEAPGSAAVGEFVAPLVESGTDKISEQPGINRPTGQPPVAVDHAAKAEEQPRESAGREPRMPEQNYRTRPVDDRPVPSAADHPDSASDETPPAVLRAQQERAEAAAALTEAGALPKSDDNSARARITTAAKSREEPLLTEKKGHRGNSAGKGGAESLGEPRLDGVQFAQIVVRGGDSLSGIAHRKYGQASYTILDLLRLANPGLQDIDVIAVGQTIRLPELGEGFPILNDGSGHYGLLVFSTPHPARAISLQSALRTQGFEAHVSGGSLGSQRSMFRVVVSGFAGRDEVAEAGRRLQKLFREDARVAQLGK